MTSLASITRVEFTGYKALGNFSIELERRNILVGPNNCGKSTVIGAFRILAEGLRLARSKSTEIVGLGGSAEHCYRIPEEAIAVSTENVHTNYDDIDSTIAFTLSNGKSLTLVFPRAGGCFLVPGLRKGYFPSSFRSAFPITVSVVPVLGPLEHDEPKVKLGTVRRSLHTTRASRHFRNYWLYYPEEFARFSELIEQTWPNMSVTPPEDDGDTVHMFCSEDRIARELFWAGFGFQIWCQLCTHLNRGRQESIVVVDEPEIYLHPDLQRKLAEMLFSLGPALVMATHSAEMISVADVGDLVLINKKARNAHRLSQNGTLQQALDSIGSFHRPAWTSDTISVHDTPSQGVGDAGVKASADASSATSSTTRLPLDRQGRDPRQLPVDDADQRLAFAPVPGSERLSRWHGDLRSTETDSEFARDPVTSGPERLKRPADLARERRGYHKRRD